MHSAAWGDESGSVVTFKLPTQEDTRNPFHAYTKRRKGRAGTRFMMVCHRIVGEDKHREAVYEDEVMLAGWNDSQQNGHTAKFWIAADLMGHPFDGIGRKERLLISLVELDDDNEPIDPNMRDRVEKQGKRPSERLSYAAAMMCKNPEFHEYLAVAAGGDTWSEDDARVWLCNRLNIDSRAELDDPANKLAIEEFHEVRHNFLASQTGDPF